jgi:uncharacterized damage-inducible protein DinB
LLNVATTFALYQKTTEMPTFQSKALLAELEATLRGEMEEAERFRDYTESELKQRPADGGWSIVEVLFHLNYYAGFYTEAIEKAIDKNADRPSTEHFSSGWLGNYFTNIIGPPDENGQLKMKMKSPPDAVPPLGSELDPQQELDKYLAHQRKLLKLLHQARSRNLGTIRVPISISRWIRLKLGDTFRFVIAHQQRHHQQILRI